MSRRNLKCPVYVLGVTNLSNLLEFMQLGVICRLGGHHDRRRWPLRTLGYERCCRNLLQDKENFGILF